MSMTQQGFQSPESERVQLVQLFDGQSRY